MATTAAELHNSQYTEALIPLHLIDEPENPERETMNELELAELALSIDELGLIESLVVKRKGECFGVIAGHRRLLACRIVQYSPVPCRIRTDGEIDHDAILIAENAHREDPNPVEEARFYQRILVTKANNDVDQLCALVRRKRDFVEGRLLLLQMNPKIVDALARNLVKIAVARQLAQIEDPNRLLILLDVAINQGGTARQVAEWVREANGQEAIVLPTQTPEELAAAANRTSAMSSMRCIYCGSTKHTHTMHVIWVHDVCEEMLTQLTPAGPPNNPG